MFDGIESPVTQTFGLGVFEELEAASLDEIEQFFKSKRSPILHEVSPHAGVAALNLLCSRKYRPLELSNVLYREVERPTGDIPSNIRVRIVGEGEADRWARVHADGWAHEHPEFREFLLQLGKISAHRKQSLCFLGETDGQPASAGVLCLHEGVALLGGSATMPEFRRRGLQAALVQERMRYACDHGCDVAMIVTQPGSESQRNAERRGFRIAYTRTKWQLAAG